MKKLNPRSNPNMLVARHLLKANLDTVLESMRDWQATENLDLMFVARVPFAVVWGCDNCIITFRTLSAQTTELSLVLIRPDYLYHAEDSDDGLGILILDQVGLCPSEEAFATWSYLLNQFEALEWLDSAKLSSVYRRYGAWDSMAEELEAFNQSLEPLKRYQEYYETQYAVIEEAEEEALLADLPPDPLWHPGDWTCAMAGDLYLIALCQQRGHDPRQLITSQPFSSPAQKPGHPGLDHSELIRRFAKAQRALELKAQDPTLTLKELVQEVHWHAGSTMRSKIKLLREAMERLPKADSQLLDEIAAWREKEKKKST
jgi:hypothetical protein